MGNPLVVKVVTEVSPLLSGEGFDLLVSESHGRWVQDLRAAGRYSYPSRGGEELMVPYSELSSEEQAVARARVASVVSMLLSFRSTLGSESGVVVVDDERE